MKKMSMLIALIMIVTSFTGIFSVKTSVAGTTSFYPTDDTFINQNVPNDNMGSVAWLRVRGLTGWSIYSLIKFDVSSIPSGTLINSATLHLQYRTEEGEGNPAGHTLETHSILSDWNEETVTWNTQPTHDTNVISSAIVPDSPNVWMTWDVTNDVKSFLNGTKVNYGWKIIDIEDSTDMPYFYSTEYGDYIPYLEIEYLPPANVYVDDDFDTSTPGWGYDHFSSIQAGVDAVDVGGTVFISSGTYYENITVNKHLNLIGEQQNNTIIDQNEYSTSVVAVTADFVNISGFTINGFNWYDGLTLYSDFNDISNNSILENQYAGIRLIGSSGNTISDNTILYNQGEGIALGSGCNNNIITNNNISNNDFGVDLLGCNNNTIIQNKMSNNNLGIKGESHVNDNIISDNDITGGVHGIRLWSFCSGNTISNNIISNNGMINIELIECDNNTITGNTISPSSLGTTISSTNNLIYHNNFIEKENPVSDSGNNKWDNGYPSGGNYWYDYTGVDANGDGIGDTPYNIPGGSNQDLYPFMDQNGWELQQIAYWDFNEGTGTIAHDMIGGYDGTINGATWTTGISGSGLYFNGTNDYVQIASPVLNVPPYSVCAWINVSSLPSQAAYILSNGGQTRNSYGFYLAIYHPRNCWEFGGALPGGNLLHLANSSASTGNWYFLVGTWDGSPESNHLKLYVNGAQIGTYFSSQPWPTGSAHNLRMGATSDQLNYLYHGILDEVRVYNGVLTESEILYLYKNSGGGNQPPTADAGGPYYANVGNAINFNGSGSNDTDGTIEGYRWDFTNDGTYDTGWLTTATTTNSYPSVGTYTVKLEVKDDDGGTDTDTATATISTEGGAIPTAEANGPYSGYVDYPVLFSSSGSIGGSEGTIVSRYWTFGDGDVSSQKNPTHTYTSSGMYTVTLKVANNYGQTDNDTTTATIIELSPDQTPPVADAGGPYSGVVGSPIIFDGSGSNDSDGTIVSYGWNFGDGTTGTGITPIHTYTTAGNYTVILTVADNETLTHSNSTTANINVSGPPTIVIVIDTSNIEPIVEENEKTIPVTVYCYHQSVSNIHLEILESSNLTITVLSPNITLNPGEQQDLLIKIKAPKLPSPKNPKGNSQGKVKTSTEIILLQAVGDGNVTSNIEQINIVVIQKGATPGFELVFVLCAIAVAIFLWRKKRSI